MTEDEDRWSKLPRDLQEEFYRRAEEESKRLIERILEVDSCIREIEPYLRQYVTSLRKTSKRIKIVAVDGSIDPIASDRLGVRYGTYSAGYIMLEGKSLISEGYLGGSRRVEQSSTLQSLGTTLSFLMTRAERKAALKILDEADLIIVDGGFYSYMYRLLELPKESRGNYKKLVDEINGMTEKLVESGKCLGIIKRSRTRAIGAWDSRRISGVSQLVRLIDKLILSAILPAGSCLDYTSFLGSSHAVYVYSRIARRLLVGPKEEVENLLEALSKNDVEKELKPILNIFKESLDYDEEKAIKTLNSLTRMQARVYIETLPVELEIPVNIDRQLLEDFLGNEENFNP
ncbi:MAG: hypothetical protein RMI79_01735, partial [Nitrososphaerota archaeon]|nr:hypothetical protein [Nitrososphaerota archaeon]